MTAPLIEEYTARLRRSLPADLAQEAAAGLTEERADFAAFLATLSAQQ